MKRFVLIALVVGSLSLCAADFHPYDGPEPIAVLIQTAPWATVMGAENPRIAVYEDGTVRFLKKSKDGESYRSKKLSELELSDLEKDPDQFRGVNNVWPGIISSLKSLVGTVEPITFSPSSGAK